MRFAEYVVHTYYCNCKENGTTQLPSAGNNLFYVKDLYLDTPQFVLRFSSHLYPTTPRHCF
jgi:hypothetical protein